MPGQWGFIYFAPGSSNNSINHAIIKNGTTGLRADSLVSPSPVLTINNTEIKNMSAIGLMPEVLARRLTILRYLIVDCILFH